MIGEEKIKKWDMIGLLQEVPEKEKPKLAQLLENQARVMLNKGEDWDWVPSRMALPLVRRVWGNLGDEQKAHVMDLPACLIKDTAYLAEDCSFCFEMNLKKEFGGQGLSSGYLAMDHEVEVCSKLADDLAAHLNKQGAIALYIVLSDISPSIDGETSVISSRYARRIR